MKNWSLCAHGAGFAGTRDDSFRYGNRSSSLRSRSRDGLQANGVKLLVKGAAETVNAPMFPPLKQLLDIYVEGGGRLLACGPCVKWREIQPDADFVPGAMIVNAATFVKECTEATNVLVY